MAKASAVELQCVRHHAQHVGQFVHFGAAAAELARHARLDQAGLLEQREIFANEAVLVSSNCARRKRAQARGDIGGPRSRPPVSLCSASSCIRSVRMSKVDNPTMLVFLRLGLYWPCAGISPFALPIPVQRTVPALFPIEHESGLYWRCLLDRSGWAADG